MSAFQGAFLEFIVLCKSVVSEGKELILNWPIRFQETHGFSFLIGQFDINSFPSLTTDLQSTIAVSTDLYRAFSYLLLWQQNFILCKPYR